MTVPVSMALLTAMTGRYTRHSLGTTGDGTAAPAARGAATTPISAWRCASLPVSSTQAGRILPVLILLRQIISHREGHSRGIASNHGDPEHLWNGLGMGYTMDGFRKAVKAVMDGSAVSEPEERGWYRVRKSWADAKSQKGAFKMLANAKKCADENPGYSVYDESGKAVYSSQGSGNGFSPYLVQVSNPERSGNKLREDWEVYRERRFYHCGGSLRPGSFPLG